MADEADDAFEMQELALKYAPNPFANEPKLSPKGTCHFCEDDLEHPKGLFCDDYCEKRWRRLVGLS